MFSKYNDVGTLKCQEKARPVRLHPRLLDVVQPSTVALLRAGLAAEFLELLTALRARCREPWAAALPGPCQPGCCALSFPAATR